MEACVDIFRGSTGICDVAEALCWLNLFLNQRTVNRSSRRTKLPLKKNFFWSAVQWADCQILTVTAPVGYKSPTWSSQRLIRFSYRLVKFVTRVPVVIMHCGPIRRSFVINKKNVITFLYAFWFPVSNSQVIHHFFHEAWYGLNLF
jgi:hypothetical protein